MRFYYGEDDLAPYRHFLGLELLFDPLNVENKHMLEPFAFIMGALIHCEYNT
jgi:hypothetical protein